MTPNSCDGVSLAGLIADSLCLFLFLPDLVLDFFLLDF
jgi:hypothetical protein